MIQRPRSDQDDHDIVFGNYKSRTRAGDHEGSPGAADSPQINERPQLLGPDGNPISSRPRPPFGFRQ